MEELTQHPGGGMAQSVRAINRARDPYESTPEYVTETAGLPWKADFLKPKDPATNRYITGLGLMHEDPLGLLGMVNRPQQLSLELLSRLTPPARVPLELTFGQVSHQRDASGGRNIEDLDPNIARALQNISDTIKGTTTQDIEAPLGINKPAWQRAEVLTQMLPISRAASTVRQLFDTRKQLPIRAMNLLTGLRVTDVSPAAQDAILRERIDTLKRGMGAREFPTIYFPEEVKSRMSPAKLEKALEMEALQRAIEGRKRKRKKDQLKAAFANLEL